MRLAALFFLAVAGSLSAGEGPASSAYPLWDGHESVAEYAKKVNLPPTKTLDLGNGVNIELVLIPAGKFIMGTPRPEPVGEEAFYIRIFTGQTLLAVGSGVLLVLLAFMVTKAIRKRQRPKFSLLRLVAMTLMAGVALMGGLHWRQSVRSLENAQEEYPAAQERFRHADSNEKPAHPVTITKPFYMGKFAVTQEQYQQVTGQNPSEFKGKDNPVETVSWDDAQAFCKKVTEQTKQTVRLPTEAEWEFSCRAGTTTAYYSGDTEPDLARVAWYADNSKNTTHPVGQKEPNAFGLYDMHGNVYQACQDWYDSDYYGESVAENPQGPPPDTDHILRGGSWRNSPTWCRSAKRTLTGGPGYSSDNEGFRVVVEPAFKGP